MPLLHTFSRSVLFFAFSAGFSLVSVSLARAAIPGEVATPGAYGKWSLVCREGKAAKQCHLAQVALDFSHSGAPVRVLILRRAGKAPADFLRVVAPLNTIIGPGVGIRIDGREQDRLAFLRCGPDGCIAETRIDHAFRRTLLTGKILSLTFHAQESDVARNVVVSLAGLSDGLAALQ